MPTILPTDLPTDVVAFCLFPQIIWGLLMALLSISHVINYDMPDSTDAYTHRIGRTGRVEKTGDAFTFVTSEDKAMVRALERVLHATLERRKLDGFDYAGPVRDVEAVRSTRQFRQPAAEIKRTVRRQPVGARQGER